MGAGLVGEAGLILVLRKGVVVGRGAELVWLTKI